jgi:hypothetical protein
METTAGTHLYVRLVGADRENDSAIPLADLVKSLYGLEQVLDDFARICKLNGEIIVTANPPEEGSFVIGICVDLKMNIGQLPFDSVTHLMEFLKIASDSAWAGAVDFFKELDNIRSGVNAYFEKRTFDLALFTLAVPYLINLAKKQKKSPLPVDDKASKRISKEVHSMIRKNTFRNLLSPVINESVVSIEVSPDRNFHNATARIEDNNLEELLAKESQILPELKHGKVCKLEGSITSLKSTRGDSLTFHYFSGDGDYNLVYCHQMVMIPNCTLNIIKNM